MHAADWLEHALILLAAAALAVPLFSRLKLSAVLAYLAVGAGLGPHALGVVDTGNEQLALAELGVVLLMFLVGLELSPARLWLMRRAVFGIGSLQYTITAALLFALATGFGLGWKAALVVGGALALSSTAIGVQLLAERKALGQPHGRTALGILLLQDLAAIPALALVPLLGVAAQSDDGFSTMAVLRGVAAIVAVVVFGRWLVRPLFRMAAKTRSVETFSATTLVVALGAAWLTGLAGLSMALGAFLGGILLADSEYRHEIESHLEPFKGLLLGLFFVSVGMSVDWSLVLARWSLVLAGVVALLLLKALVLYPLARRADALTRADAVRLAAAIAQGGEFAFVLLALAFGAGVLAADLRDLLSACIVLSMAATPLLVIVAERWAERLEADTPAPEFDVLPEHSPRVVIAGFGRVGQMVGRLLHASRIPFIALEHSVEQVELSRRFGNLIYYGDPARPETLRAAGTEHAEVFVIATDDAGESLLIARLVRRLFPHVRIVARARNRQHVFALWEADVPEVVRETFHSSLKMARKTLEALGIPEARARRRVWRFRMQDEAMLRTQHEFRDDEARLIQGTHEAMAELQALFEADAVEGIDESSEDDERTP
jgi:glutathione-regulated potassium-efflux system protein KefB